MNRELPGGFFSLPTEDPLVCAPDEKAAIETANCVKQLAYIEYLVERGIRDLRESHVQEFQALAIEGLYRCGGAYRTWTRSAVLEGGGATHIPPEPALIPGLVRHAVEFASDPANGHATTRAGYVLWRLNWIHPFAGGNGRTARALAYLVMCVDSGRLIPGQPSIPTLIAARHEEYVAALREADAGEAAGQDRTSRMAILVCDAAIESLEAALARARAQGSI